MLIHVWTQYEAKNPETRQRNDTAQLTWRSQFWHEVPVRDSDLPRLFKDEAGSVPFIKDVLDIAWRKSKASDIIIYTNADICVRSDCSLLVAYFLQDLQACYSYRRDFYSDFSSPKPDNEIDKGAQYAGCDLFAFRASWWGNHRKKFPDVLLGRESWDAVMRTMIDWTHPPTEASLIDLIYHRKHASPWEIPSNRTRIAGQLHCRKIVRQWCSKHNIPSLVAP